jgi:adenylate kinase family enzyme
LLRSARDVPPGCAVGLRVVVTGLAGSGKSTFSKALAEKTGLPLIHLDLHFWQPGWVAPSDDLWRDEQRALVASDKWILDGNYHETLELRLERATTAVYLDTPWGICAWRALGRGVRKRPVDCELPEGCDEPAWRRLRDEWRLAGRLCRDHRSQRETELAILSRHADRVAVYVLASKHETSTFLSA